MNLQKPFLSIIIPTYNAGDCVGSAINSLLNQVFVDFEIIVIDGQSQDQTIKIVRELADKDKRIVFISESDKGIYDAMNKGIKLAKGEWVYFLGSDDSLCTNSLETIIPFLTEDMDVVYGDVVSTRFGGRYDGPFDESKIYKKNICHQSIFFNKNVFESIGNFNLKYKAHADWDHNMRWLLNLKIKKRYVDIVVANYADGGFSSLNKDLIFSIDKRFNYLKYGLNLLPYRIQSQLSKEEAFMAMRSKDIKRLFISVVFYLRSFLYA